MFSVEEALAREETALTRDWARLQQWLAERFGRAHIGLEGVLFLIGVQASGRGFEPKLEKETKQDLIMEGTYCCFEALGLYRRIGMEADGRWIWERTEALPDLSIEAQEKLLRIAVLEYFEGLMAP